MIRWSPSTRGFYDGAHPAIPDDAVAISKLQHRRLLEGQAAGRPIRTGASGRPELVPLARAPLDQQRAEAVRAVKAEARRRILAIASLERQANDNATIAVHAAELALGSEHRDAGGFRAAMNRRSRIDAIRAASDAIEAVIARMPAANLDRFDPSSHPLWPSE